LIPDSRLWPYRTSDVVTERKVGSHLYAFSLKVSNSDSRTKYPGILVVSQYSNRFPQIAADWGRRFTQRNGGICANLRVLNLRNLRENVFRYFPLKASFQIESLPASHSACTGVSGNYLGALT
jgi:hypothetical protein